MPNSDPATHKPQSRHRSTTSLSLRLLLSSFSILILALFSLRAIPRVALLKNHLFSSSSSASASSSVSVSPSTASTIIMSYAKELRVAQVAVQRATLLTKRVFHEKAKGTVDKSDKSPVTIGDFGAQALIIAALRHNFPDDAIVAEEEAAQLRADPNLADQIWSLVRDTRLPDPAAEELLGGSVPNLDAMLDLIDRGNSPGGAHGRIWAIDPIDGTKGFLRGGQYAVCLALLVDGQVQVGVLGCPNLPIDDSAPLSADIGVDASDEDGRGVLFSAVRGGGAHSAPLSAPTAAKPISMRPVSDMTAATFCESVEAAHSAHGDQAEIARRLGISRPSVRMDSQSKYGSIARGAGDIYLRLPVKATYQEKIWDHAAGDLIVREAGGQVTDVDGKALDFSVGRTLANNKGVVAAPAAVHGEVLKAVQDVLRQKSTAA
ncbi:3',5'-bisphosphate nucleotidase [Sodiomyces alkalinus F11]|uniref:3'(2'),5'-bisphosphate nucleotidase n=1 Tax=Sodiomyces alkalinus (strain CBS 110278 / VKM F-3762 / F11) TaxID=1314773 RepID=A0A3N2PKN6_SODAK|nr:3',5'-bisphosphate nucleotidase [Sodiomyces alkalinus F11]ROT34886.1 3',5'-bisphosphate nucleotidase [Sodiomyces alkalinus F11]